MLNVFKNERKKRTLLTLAALFTALALLISCSPQGGKEETPSASASITDTIAESSSTAPVPTESETTAFEDPEDDKAVFEGVVGQSWYAFDIPLFQEMGRARDLAYGAGQLWVVGIQRGVDDESFSTPPLMVSRDAFHWEQVDLSALGLPEDLSGEARLLGSEEEIIVIFENPGGMKTNGDKPQHKPWILRGDGENWQVISDESFGPWQENNRGSGKFLHYWDLNAFSLYEDDLILMPNIGWFEPYSTSDQALGLGRVSSDGKAQLVADKAGFQSDYYLQQAYKMLNYQDELIAFASSYKAGQEGMYFNLWRSNDGENWTNETPNIPDIPAYVSVTDAVEGPKGIVAVGWESPMEDGGLGTPLPIALFSADGETWSFSTFGQEWDKYYRIAANEEAYFAYEADNQVWTSTDGQSWTDLSPLQYYKVNIDNEWVSYPLSSFRMISIVGFPEGLVAVGEKSVLFSGQLPFDYLNQK